MKLAKEIRSPRRYDDACAAAHAMDVIGERWAMPVMRELMLGPRRFSDLRAALPDISANVLSQRLDGLEAGGVLHRRRLPPPASVQVYELTRWGYEAGPVFQAMGRWAARSPRHDPTRPFSAVSLMFSLRTMLDPARAAGQALVAGFVLGEEDFAWRLASDGGVAIARGAPADADFTLRGDPRAIAAFVHGGTPLADLVADGVIAVEGDEALAARFPSLFPPVDRAGA